MIEGRQRPDRPGSLESRIHELDVTIQVVVPVPLLFGRFLVRHAPGPNISFKTRGTLS